MSDPIVLVGLPGAGKTTVGRALADLLGAEFRDTDEDIAAKAGKPVSEIFVDDGEEAFRAMERAAVAEAVEKHGGILSLGGGAVTSEETRRVLAEPVVVHLKVEIAEALRRAQLDAPRPLLRVNPRATLRALAEQRLPLYGQVATHEIETTGKSPERLAREIARLTRWRSVPVNDRERPYEAHIGAGTAGLLEEYAADADRVAVIHTASTEPHAREIAAPLIDAKHVVTLEIPDAEQGKDLSVLAQCWEALGEETFTRTDLVVGVGGGAVTDLAGFAAATWLRGIDVVHVPTSLLGAVDASVGGKTGINTAAGKNLVGAFHTPRAVLCDTRYLRTLPEREAAGGLAEIVKAGFIADPGILELIENDPRAALDPSGDLVPELMARAIAVKAEVVGEDLKETGKRAFLNFGHTLAHAIEKHEDYRMRHGEAVAIGMVYAAELGRLTGRADLVARVEAILESVGLPTRYSGADWDSLHGTMLVDKKNRGATQRFVLLDALAEPAVVSDVPVEAQREAFARVREGEAPE